MILFLGFKYIFIMDILVELGRYWANGSDTIYMDYRGNHVCEWRWLQCVGIFFPLAGEFPKIPQNSLYNFFARTNCHCDYLSQIIDEPMEIFWWTITILEYSAMLQSSQRYDLSQTVPLTLWNANCDSALLYFLCRATETADNAKVLSAIWLQQIFKLEARNAIVRQARCPFFNVLCHDFVHDKNEFSHVPGGHVLCGLRKWLNSGSVYVLVSFRKAELILS